MEVALERVRAGEADPDCPECGGILKSATISFGENLVAEDLRRAQRAAARADVFLAVGTLPRRLPRRRAARVRPRAPGPPGDLERRAHPVRRVGRRRDPRARWAPSCPRSPPPSNGWEFLTPDVAFLPGRSDPWRTETCSTRRRSAIREVDPGDGRVTPRRGHVPRRPGAGRVRAGHDPRRGVHPAGPPRGADREPAARQGPADRRLLRRRVPVGVRGRHAAAARLHRRRLDGRRLRALEGRGPRLDHARGAQPRAAQPLPPPPPPPRGRRGRPAEAAREQGPPARRGRPRLARGALPRRRGRRDARHRRHGRRRRVEPAAPDPPQHRPHRRAQGRLGQEDADRS